MSTRSNIAIELPADKDGNKKVKVIYVHSGMAIHMALENAWWIIITIDSTPASRLFNHGDASYLGDTLDECSFYSRDWKRAEDPAKTFRDEMDVHERYERRYIYRIYLYL